LLILTILFFTLRSTAEQTPALVLVTCSGVKGLTPEQMSDLVPMTLNGDKHLDCRIAFSISLCESVGEKPMFGSVQLQGLKRNQFVVVVEAPGSNSQEEEIISQICVNRKSRLAYFTSIFQNNWLTIAVKKLVLQ
jgi:hypothetical protein